MVLANVADQSHLGYLALQSVIDAMKELTSADDDSSSDSKKPPPLISALKQKQKPQTKQSKLSKKGVYQLFDMISRSHLSSRLWLKARTQFVQFMFNQLTDAGKAKGNDDNITRDFGDLKYYCDKCLDETEKFYDVEAKAFFQLIDASLDLIRGSGLQACVGKLEKCLLNYISCAQLSLDGLIQFTRAALLKNDLKYTIDLLNASESGNELKQSSALSQAVNKSIESLLYLQKLILDDLRVYGNEAIECYVDKRRAYFNNLAEDIKNLYNPLLHYLVHIKLRLGSSLLLKASYLSNYRNKGLQIDELNDVPSAWQHALTVLGSGFELNKVICERSLNLEIELSYKYAFCVKELFTTKQLGTLNDVVEAFGYTINLVHNSTHDLNIVKNCYLEIAVAFIATFDASVIQDYVAKPMETPGTASSRIG
jgi:hypothetical protein